MFFETGEVGCQFLHGNVHQAEFPKTWGIDQFTTA